MKKIILEGSLCARHSLSFSSHKCPRKQEAASPFYKGGNRISEKLGNWLKVIKLVIDGAGV